MSGPLSPTGHGGVAVRGLTFSPSSRFFNGRFGRLFRSLPPADFGSDDAASQAALQALGDAMVAEPDPPKDGPDPEESGIPAAYTYFGQFIDHDLTFDPASSLQRQNDPEALIDFRTPRFDLDCVYGRGPDDQPYLYGDGRSLLLGDPLTGDALGTALNAHDLPRSGADPARAIIGDPRNDENVIVSQLQGLMLRLHNLVASQHTTWTFQAIQQEVRFHYQWVVLNDFLPTVVDEEVLEQVFPRRPRGTPNLQFFTPHENAFMPLEFSAAAYRFGHSMVRPGYRLNDAIEPQAIFPALAGFGRFPADWAIDWGRFIDLDVRPYGDGSDQANPGNPDRTQLAYRIDTSVVDPLGHLPPHVASNPASLAQRNLLRGWRMRLPSGQDVARAMGVPVVADADILIGKFTGDQADVKGDIVAVGGDSFKGNCPLWTYILAETVQSSTTVKTSDGDKRISTQRLGPVGGRIVAETLVGLLAYDSTSFLNVDPLWEPSLAVNGMFGLRELIFTALVG